MKWKIWFVFGLCLATLGFAMPSTYVPDMGVDFEIAKKANEFLIKYSTHDFTIKDYGPKPAFSSNTITEGEEEPWLEIDWNGIVVSESFFDDDTDLHAEYGAKVYILPGDGDSEMLNTPVVIADAFDPLWGRGPNDLLNDEKMSLLFSNLGGVDNPRQRGYDIIFVDFYQGGGNLFINAAILTKVMHHLDYNYKKSYLTAGYSMGGLLTRIALLFGEKENNLHNVDVLRRVKGYLSIDAPHQGADIPTDLGKLLQIYIDNETNFKEDFGQKVGLISGELDVLSQKNYYKINSLAAAQMMYSKYYRDLGKGSDEVHNSFLQRLEKMGGYPDRILKLSIAHSNWMYPHEGIEHNGRVAWTKSDRNIYPSDRDRMAGSVSDTFWDFLKHSAKDFSLHKYGNDRYKGTFVPILSALDMNVEENFNLDENPTQEWARQNSPFDEVWWMKRKYNCYNNFPKIDGCVESTYRERFQHGLFDQEIVSMITNGLQWLDAQYVNRELVEKVPILF